MSSKKSMMHALAASSVAMVIGGITREVELTTVLPAQSEPEMFAWPIAGHGPWWTLSSILFVAGAVVGALLAGPAWSRFGNRISMALFDAVLISGLVAVTLPLDSTELTVAGRLLLGVGSGALSAIVPTYVGEISQPKIRGRLSVLFPIVVVTGFVISEAFGNLNKVDQNQPLNILFNVYCLLIVMLHGIGLCFIHKSPYSPTADDFSEQRENDEFGLQTLLSDSQRMERLLALFTTDYHYSRRRSSYLADEFRFSVNRRALLIGIGCMFFHQMCGINSMKSYMIHLMKMSDIQMDPKTVFVILGIVQVIMMGIAIIFIDYKSGRRVLLISSAVIMCLCLASLAFCNITKMHLNASTLRGVSMILVMIFIMAYSLGFGPVPWVIMGEIFSTKMKPYGLSISTAVHWLLVVAGVFCPYAISQFCDTKFVFLVHLVVCLFGVLFSWKIIPETTKFNLSQIQWEIDASIEVVSYIPYSTLRSSCS